MTTSANINSNACLNLDDYLYAMQQRNLVYNSDFRYYSNKVYNGDVVEYGIPDGWLYDDPGKNGKIGFDTAVNACLINKSDDSKLMRFSQALHEFPRWANTLKEETVTAKVFLNISTANDVSVTLSDGIDSTTITKKGPGDFEIDVRQKINKGAKYVLLSIECSAPFVTIKITSVCANVGVVAINSLPCIVEGIIGERKQYISTESPPAEELSLCNKAEELGENYTRLDSVINRRFGAGANKRSLLPDMRGYFSRAWNNGSSIDPDAANRTPLGQGTIKGDHVSSVENDEFLKHDHPLNFSSDKPILTGKEGSATTINTANTSNTKQVGGKETRPKNLAELYTIKWA